MDILRIVSDRHAREQGLDHFSLVQAQGAAQLVGDESVGVDVQGLVDGRAEVGGVIAARGGRGGDRRWARSRVQDRKIDLTSSAFGSGRERSFSRHWAVARVFSSTWIASRKRAPMARNCRPEARNPTDHNANTAPPMPTRGTLIVFPNRL